MTTWLHQQRFAAVRGVLAERRAVSVADLGCGAGDFLIPLAQDPGIARVIGVEPDATALAALRRRVAGLPGDARARVSLHAASVLALPADLPAVDAAILIEVIEHLDPTHLALLERQVFGRLAPATVVLTTPNAEFNPLLGVPARRMRHPGHRFEWTRARFAEWARGIGARQAYSVSLHPVGGAHPSLGGASQMAVFLRDTKGKTT